MQFNTFLYILAFLPLTAAGWFITGHFSITAAKLFLIAASFFFYGYAGIPGLVWFLVSIAVNYAVTVVMRHLQKAESRSAVSDSHLSPSGNTPGSHADPVSGSVLQDSLHILRIKKLVLWAGIIFNIALLAYFKYTNFAITAVNQLTHSKFPLVSDIVLPLGISFFTFQQISYIVDSYKGLTRDNTVIDYLLYVTFFPKVLMGPIVKQDRLLEQFRSPSVFRPSSENMSAGIRMFVTGLFKKVILADTFARAVSWAFGLSDLSEATSMDLILAALAYTFQIYFDFSGYSDMASGSALIMNISLPMNFDSPYKAYSIRDFWKRWHISLTKFLTEYIYIPLGGSRKGKIRTYINTMIVFLVSGIWHGANWTFILWGLLHGAFSVFDRLTEKLRKHVHPALQWMLTFAVVNVLWLLFRSDSVSQWLHAVKHIAAFQNTAVSDGLVNSFILPETAVLVRVLHLGFLNSHVRGFSMIVFYAVSLIMCLGFENTNRKKYSNGILTAFVTAAIFVFTLTCIGTESVFIYNNF